MQRTILKVLAALTFVAAVWWTVPAAVNEQRTVLARRSQASSEVADPTALPAAGATQVSTERADLGPAPDGLLPRAIYEARQVKEGFRVFLVTNGMGWAWDAWLRARGYLFDARAWLWAAFFVLLEQLMPVKPLRRFLSANRLLDLMYPVFSASIRVVVILLAYNPINYVYETHLSFLHTRWLEGLPLFWQGFGAFLVLDFGHWMSHWTRHKVRWLWYFHAVHHSQTEMSPWTAWRAHPFEEIWNWALILIPAGLFGGDRSMWIVVTILYGVVWPPFTHANIRTNLGPLKYLIVSPQYHRVHHSNDPKQYDCNFGEHLILWDWLFGTMWKDMNSYPETGIPNGEFIEERSRTPWGLVGAWARQCLYPFLMIGRSVRGAVAGAAARFRGGA